MSFVLNVSHLDLLLIGVRVDGENQKEKIN